MDKNEFERTVTSMIAGESAKEQMDDIQQMMHFLNEMKSKLADQYHYCTHCKEMYKKEDFKTVTRTEVWENTCVYSDCGYGEDDEYADVTYNVTYMVCPECGGEEYISKEYVSEKNRWRRGDFL